MAGTLTKTDRGSLYRPGWEGWPLAGLRDEMDEMFKSFFGTGSLQPMTPGTLPSIDMSETDKAVEIKTDVPGFQPDEIDIDIEDGMVTISGERSEEKEEKGDGRKYHRVERRSGSFSRMVRLPCSVNEDNVDAQLKDGVLTLTLPKSETAKRQKIKVKG